MNIGIAGGGLLGSLLAFNLIKKGCKVKVFEKNSLTDKTSAAWVAAGMLTPYAELPISNENIFLLGKRSLELWPCILEQLKISHSLILQGSLLIAFPEAQQELNHLVNKIKFKYPKADLVNTVAYSLEPEISLPGYFLREEGFLVPELFMTTIQKFLKEKGVSFLENALVDKVTEGCIVTKNKSYKFDWVFDCRGIGAKQHFNDLRAVRGEIIHLYAPEVNISRPIRLIDPKHSIYIVPRPQKQFVIGATEIEVDDGSEISVRSCIELLSKAYKIHSGFAEARIIDLKTACRPALIDNAPKIIHQYKCTAINGLYRHGYLLAPALLEQVESEFHESYC